MDLIISRLCHQNPQFATAPSRHSNIVAVGITTPLRACTESATALPSKDLSLSLMARPREGRGLPSAEILGKLYQRNQILAVLQRPKLQPADVVDVKEKRRLIQ